MRDNSQKEDYKLFRGWVFSLVKEVGLCKCLFHNQSTNFESYSVFVIEIVSDYTFGLCGSLSVVW